MQFSFETQVSSVSKNRSVPLSLRNHISRISHIRQIQMGKFFVFEEQPRGRSGTSSFTCLPWLIVLVDSVEQISRYRNNPLQNRAHNNRY